jgi:hypothetical protein
MNVDRRRYSIIPIRALPIVKRAYDWRVLAALCTHTSPRGVCYPNQSTLSELVEIPQPHVSAAIKRLHEMGLVRMLRPVGKKHPRGFQRGNRYQVLYEPNAPLPGPLEMEIPWGSRVNRW